jgi:hypothetical protein
MPSRLLGSALLEQTLQTVERDDRPDAFESALLDLPGLAVRQAERTRRLGEVPRMAVEQPHAVLEHPSLHLGKALEDPVERSSELTDALVLSRAAPPPPGRRAPLLATPLTTLTASAAAAAAATSS